MSFVPLEDILASYDILLESEFFVENEQILSPLIDYFEDTWIGRLRRGRRKVPSFKHNLWNNFQVTAESHRRTNNSIEGWHNRLSVLVGAHHPTVWKLIEKLQLEQSTTEFKLTQLVAGTPSQPKRRKYKDLDKRLLTVVEKYGTIPILEYLEGIAHNICLNV